MTSRPGLTSGVSVALCKVCWLTPALSRIGCRKRPRKRSWIRTEPTSRLHLRQWWLPTAGYLRPDRVGKDGVSPPAESLTKLLIWWVPLGVEDRGHIAQYSNCLSLRTIRLRTLKYDPRMPSQPNRCLMGMNCGVRLKLEPSKDISDLEVVFVCGIVPSRLGRKKSPLAIQHPAWQRRSGPVFLDHLSVANYPATP